jgi:hypothetical protein
MRTKKQKPAAPAMYRQGDVLIARVDAIPAGVKTRARENGRVILAHGEVTGHAHAVDVEADPSAAIFDSPEGDGSFFLRIGAATGLVHEEHARIDLAPGDYRITRQREWTDADEPRQVAD